MYQILASTAASITELKANPMKLMESAEGATVAILNRNKPEFYCVPAARYEALMNYIEDMQDIATIREREGQPTIEVKLEDLVTWKEGDYPDSDDDDAL